MGKFVIAPGRLAYGPTKHHPLIEGSVGRLLALLPVPASGGGIGF